ncbi:hypothetical protein [Microviridae sp.]|nr:hypothetical protein [Microviridae sp.]
MTSQNEYELPFGTHRIKYATTAPILINLQNDPVRALPPGSGTLVLRNCEGLLSVDNTAPKVPFKFDITTRKQEKGEKVDNLPPPQPAPPDNYLAQIREKVRQSFGVIREDFASQPTMYEQGDVDLFEEDLKELKKEEWKKKQAEKKAAEEEAAAEADKEAAEAAQQKTETKKDPQSEV